MWSFLGLRKESSKKSTSERETDGFVIIGETVEEQRQKTRSANIVQPATNVVVQPFKSSSASHSRTSDAAQTSTGPQVAPPPPQPQGADVTPGLPELLGDVPFTLAPHILAMQSGVAHVPDLVLPRDINDNLSSFQYDFSLENSVLSEP